MTIYEMIKTLLDTITRCTLNGICIGFWIILIAEIWKWFWGILKAFFYDLFSGTKDDV